MAKAFDPFEFAGQQPVSQKRRFDPFEFAGDFSNEGSVAGDLGASALGGGNSLVSIVGGLYGLATGDMDNSVYEWAQENRTSIDAMKSDDLRMRERRLQESIASADGFFDQAAAAVWGTVSDPYLMLNMVAEQLPLLVATGGSGIAASAGAKALGAGTKTAVRAGTSGAAVAGGAMNAADVGSGAYEQQMSLPDNIWNANEEFLNRSLDVGAEEAKKEISLRNARAAAAAVGAVSGLTTFLPGTIEKTIVGDVDIAKGGLLKGIGFGIAGEGAQEVIEEGGGQFASNLATRNVDPNQDVLEGVGGAAGQALALGGAIGGVGGGIGSQLRTDYDPFAGKEPSQVLAELQARAATLNARIENGLAPDFAEAQRAALMQDATQARLAFPKFSFDLGAILDPISTAAKAGQAEARAQGQDNLGQAANAAARVAQTASQTRTVETPNSRTVIETDSPQAADTVESQLLETEAQRQQQQAALTPGVDLIGSLRVSLNKAIITARREQRALGDTDPKQTQELEDDIGRLQLGLSRLQEARRYEEEGNSVAIPGILSQVRDIAERPILSTEFGRRRAFNYINVLEGELMPRIDETIALFQQGGVLPQTERPALRAPADFEVNPDGAARRPRSTTQEQVFPDISARGDLIEDQSIIYGQEPSPEPPAPAPQPTMDFAIDARGNVARTPNEVATRRNIPTTPLLEMDVEDRPSTQVLRKKNGDSYPTRQSASVALARVKRSNLDYNWNVIEDGSGFALEGRLPEGLPPREVDIQSIRETVRPRVSATDSTVPLEAYEESNLEPVDARFDGLVEAYELGDVAPLVRELDSVAAQRGDLLTRRMNNPVSTDDDVLTAITKAGGIDLDEAVAQGLDPADNPGRGKLSLFRRKGGMTLDGVAEFLAENGFTQPAGETYEAGLQGANEALGIVADALNARGSGSLTFLNSGKGAQIEILAQREMEIEQELEEIRTEIGENLTPQDQVLLDQFYEEMYDEVYGSVNQRTATSDSPRQAAQAGRNNVTSGGRRGEIDARAIPGVEGGSDQAIRQDDGPPQESPVTTQTEPQGSVSRSEPPESSQSTGGADTTLATYTEEELRERAETDTDAAEQRAQVDRERELFGLDPGEGTIAGTNDPTQTDAGQGALSLDSEQEPLSTDVAEDLSRREPAERIEDFGERIAGARKDLGITFTQAISDDELDVEAVPLSKSVPQPDYAKLAEEGVDREVLAAVAIIRSQLKPAKPKRAYKLRAWVKDVNQARELIRRVTEGELAPADAIASMDFSGSFYSDEQGAQRVLKLVANADPAKLAKVAKFRISSFRGMIVRPDGSKLESSENPLFYITEVGKGSTRSRDVFESFEEAEAALESRISEAQDAKQTKQSNINIYQNRSTKEIYLGWKGSTGVIEIMEFATGKEAREYLNNNREDVEKRLAELKEQPKMRRETNRPRQGKERRAMVEDVTPELFAETFGFRGVQFGNYVEGDRRQKDLNQAFDALMDLADVLKVPPRALSLDGSLGLAFGARGKGGREAASAHYEPGQVVINLTKRSGAGSLAHEWWHSVDNYFSRQRNRNDEFFTDTYGSRRRDGDQIRPEMIDAFRGVMAAIGKTNLKKRGERADKGRSKKYWSTPVEMSARSFEKFVIDMLELKGVTNDYLANISTEGDIGPEAYPYPNRLEAETINPAYTAFFDELKFRDTDQGVAMYSRLPDRDGVQQVDNPSRREVLGKIAKAAVVGAAGVQTGSYYLDVLTDPALVRGKAKPISDFVNNNLPEASLDALRENDLVAAIDAATEGAPTEILELANTIKRLLPSANAYSTGVKGGRWNVAGAVTLGKSEVKPELLMYPESSDTGGVGTLLHEALHLVIVARYRSLSMSGGRNYEALGMDQPAGREALDQWIGLWKEFQETINPNRFVGQKERDLVDAAPFAEQIAYGDPDEFFTRALTDPEFQGRLHAIDYQGKTLWERFKDWVKTFLFKPNTGVQPTFLDATLTAAHDIFQSANFDRPDMAFSEAVNDSYAASRRRGSDTQNEVMENRISNNEPAPFQKENERIREKNVTLVEKIKQKARRELTPGGLLPKAVFDEKITRDNQLASVEFDTIYYVKQLEKAVVNTMGGSIDVLPADQKARLNEALAGKLDDSLPEPVKKAVIGMRESIDGLSKQYIEILDRQSGELLSQFSGPQRELLDAYMMAAESGDKREANAILDEAKEQFRESAEAEGLSQDLRKPIQDIQKVMSQLSLLNIIRSNTGTYVNRSYRAFDDSNWFENVPDSVLNSARQYLSTRMQESGMDPDRVTERVEVVLNDILKEGTAYGSIESFIKESKLGAKDLSILQKRKEIAPEIRALLGEYEDPRVNYAKTTTKMARLIHNTRLLDKIKEIGMGDFLFTEDNRPANTTQIAVEGNKTLEPLNGLYAPREVAQAFSDIGKVRDFIQFPEAIVRINGGVKFGKTVLAPTTQFRNFMSAAFFAMANGHWDLRKTQKSLSVMREYFTRDGDTGKLAYLRRLKELGVVYDTPFAGEMMRLLEETKLFDGERAEMSPLQGAVKDLATVAQRMYQFGDDFWKIVGYENERANLVGTGMSETEAEVEAANRIRNTYPTYSLVGNFVNALRRFPFAGTFVSFPAEIIRTQYNMIKIAAEDMKTPGRRAMGIKRLTGMSMAAAMPYAIQSLTKEMFDVSDDEEEAVRLMAPYWSENSNLLFMGRNNKQQLEFLDVSFMDPYNYFKRPINAALRDQPWEESFLSGAKDMIRPFFGTDIFAGALIETYNNKKATGGRIYNESDSLERQYADMAGHISKAVEPGIIGNARRIYKAAAAPITPYGKVYTLEDEAAAFFGFRTTTFDPKAALKFRSYEIKERRNEASSQLRKVLSNPNLVGDEGVEEAIERSLNMRQRTFDEALRLISASKSAGLTDLQVIENLRGANFGRLDIGYLMKGEVPPMVVSPATVKRQYRSAFRVLGQDKAEQLLERYGIAQEILAEQFNQ